MTFFLFTVAAFLLGWVLGQWRATREFDEWFKEQQTAWEPEALMYRYALGFRERVDAEPDPIIRQRLELHARVLEQLYVRPAKAKA